QGLADGYFIAPYTLGNYFAGNAEAVSKRPATDHSEFKKTESEVGSRIKRLLSANGKRTANEIHREVGRFVWEKCGMARNEKGLKELIQKLPEYRESFWKDVHVPGSGEELNMAVERAARVVDLIEFAELMAHDALVRDESCGGHFREEHQTPDGQADRVDDKFMHVSAWEYTGTGSEPTMHKEPLEFTEVKPAVRSYK